MLKRVIFAVGDEELEEDIEPLSMVLERQISYFADEAGLDAFLKHLGDNPWSEVLRFLRDGFDSTNTRTPFSLWKVIETCFRDLICGLTNFDPAKRLTAREALKHKWFADAVTNE